MTWRAMCLSCLVGGFMVLGCGSAVIDTSSSPTEPGTSSSSKGRRSSSARHSSSSVESSSSLEPSSSSSVDPSSSSSSAATSAIQVSSSITPSSSGPNGLCDNTCAYARNNVCDDGGPNSDFNDCALGTDCADCGPRTP